MSKSNRATVVGVAVCVIALAGLLASWAAPRARSAEELARQILRDTGVRGGLVVHLPCGDGRLTAALCASESFLVHGLDPSAENVRRAREYIRSRGLYGRVSAATLRGRKLPYAENMVNLLVAEDLGRVSMTEVMRVLRPGGVAYVRKGRGWRKVQKPWPEDIDQWTHWLHGPDGNAVGNDRVVGPPRRLQWTAGPLWSRHHDTVPSTSAMVSANGRVFYISDEAPAGIDGRLPDKWYLVARDAFNGTLLWKRPMGEWGWRAWSAKWLGRFNQPTHLPKRLVAVGDTVYVTLAFNAPLSALDAATGKTLRVYRETEYTDEILYDDGLLILGINETAQKPSTPDAPPVKKSVCVLDARSGRILWRRSGFVGVHSKADSVRPFGRLELTVGDGQVFLVDQNELVSLDLRTGKELWRIARPPAEEFVALFGMEMHDLCVLVYHDGVLLFAQPEMEIRDPWHTIPGTLYAFSGKTGELLWKHRYGGWAHFGQPDVFVIGGLVWVHEHLPVKEGTPKNKHFIANKDKLQYSLLGLDLRTGQLKRKILTRKIFYVGHHHRCYRNKSTVRYILSSRRGVEFVDLKTGRNYLNHWTRGGCLFGVVPCNGLLYVTPHPCSCYIATKLNGFFALAPELRAGEQLRPLSVQKRLERGPAYGKPLGPAAAPEDWPTYRHDELRSGTTASVAPTSPRVLWQKKIGPKLSAPTIAAGKVFLAAIDEHRVLALDADSGSLVWEFIAGGRVDSPPTYFRGLVLFGSADGWVYCLRAEDGALVWRRLCAPVERLVGAYGQLESAWPVHGSVLVRDGIAYVAAGRSSYLDGGIYLCMLDPATGKMLREQVVYSPDPRTGEMPPGDAFSLPGALCDILVSDGRDVYMRQMKVLDSGQGGAPHLISTAGLLDPSWFNRTQWAVGAVSRAQLLVFDENNAYGVQAYGSISRQRFFFPGKKGYVIFSGPWKKAARKAPGKSANVRNALRAGWQIYAPVRGVAMALAGQVLFVAGPPDVVDPADPLGAFEGRKGGLLWALAARDGKKLAELRLDSPPTFDGLAVARGRLYLTTLDGHLVCLGQ